MVYPADVVLFEGILVFYSQEIRDMFHLRLFVDTDSDVRLSRRGKALGRPAPGRGWAVVSGSDGGLLAPVAAVLRDVNRGRDLEQILTQYTTFVKPAFEEFCLPVPPAFSPSRDTMPGSGSWWGGTRPIINGDSASAQMPRACPALQASPA